MFKKAIAISSFVILVAPILASAQSAPAIPTLPTNIDLSKLPNNLPAPISGFVDQLKSIWENGFKTGVNVSFPSAAPSGNLNLSPSGVLATWASVNQWFSSNVGISLRDIVKTGANFIIWFWELIIKLIQQGLAYL